MPPAQTALSRQRLLSFDVSPAGAGGGINSVRPGGTLWHRAGRGQKRHTAGAHGGWADELSAGAAAGQKRHTPGSGAKLCKFGCSQKKHLSLQLRDIRVPSEWQSHGWRMDHRQHKEHCCGNNCISCCIKGIQ